MKELNEAIKNADEIVIYGAGHIGDLLCGYISMLECSEKIISFAVTKTTNLPATKHGIRINDIDTCFKEWPDAILIIAVHERSVAELVRVAKISGYDSPVCFKSQELLDTFYEALYQYPIQKNKVFFMNYYGRGYGCNPKYIAQELIKSGEDYEIIWGIDDNEYSFPKEIRPVRIGTYEYYKELATSGVWIDNVRKTADIKKREGQFYVQTWHGAAPFKKVEGDLIGKAPALTIEYGKRDSEMADLFVSGSSFYSALYRNAFWYEGEILDSGLPRQDIFWHGRDARKKVFSRYEIDNDKHAVLYAPTFRDNGRTECFDIDIDKLKDAVRKHFGKDCVLLVGKHPINRNLVYAFDESKYIDVSTYDDFEEILAATDTLITDYSGCIYDYSFSGRPAFLYQPDYDEMTRDRGFYVSTERMPYPVAHDMDELVKTIDEFDEEKYKNELEYFMKQFGNFDDGKASEKVFKRVFLTNN